MEQDSCRINPTRQAAVTDFLQRNKPISFLGMPDSPDTVRRLVAARIKELGLDMAGLSLRLGKNRTYLQQYLAKGSPKWLPEDVRPKLAELLNISEIQLSRPSSHPVHSQLFTNETQMPVPVTMGTGQLEVRGMAEGGPDGWNLWNGDVIQYINMPANLVGVKGAYAVYVRGESMIPRYRPGELAHIHPTKPVQPGDYVLVQRKPANEGEPPLAVIKLLVRRTGSKLILAQHNPAKEIEVHAAEVVSIHRVVGSSEA